MDENEAQESNAEVRQDQEAVIEAVENPEDSEEFDLYDPWDPALIRVDTRPFSIIQILDMIDSGDLILQPEFQRGRVWKAEQKYLLIESLLLRIPLPAFYFASDAEGQLQVIDGLQRLSTIHEFVRGSGDKENGFKLNKLEYLQAQVGGKRFRDLQGTIWARRIEQSTIIANIVDPQTPPQVKLNIFARLNKQGTPLSQQELRHAMSGSRSRAFLSRLASFDEFKEATGGSLIDSPRMHDRELVLRFIALQLYSNDLYAESGSLSYMLSRATIDIDSKETVSDLRLEEIAERFRSALQLSHLVFGGRGFRRKERSPLNRPLFEVWTYAFSHFCRFPSDAEIDEIREINHRALRNPFFQEAISANTGNRQSIERRFSKILEPLKELGLIDG